MTEDDLKLSPAQVALRDKLRNKEHVTRTDTEVSGGYSSSPIDEVSGTYERREGPNRGTTTRTGSVTRGAQGSPPAERTGKRHGKGSRPFEPENFDSPQGDGRSGEGPTEHHTRLEPPDSPVTMDNYVPNETVTGSEIEREKELNAQRQKRFRERQKQAQSSAVTVTNEVTPKFSLKKLLPGQGNAPEPEKKEVKLITSTEVNALLDDLTFIYRNGSGLLDDLIEIIVKDHEPVTIWQLDEDEAQMLAKMHLERGRVDKAAAQSARKLVELHDKIFLIMMLSPRVAATGKHVVEHGGFSFK